MSARDRNNGPPQKIERKMLYKEASLEHNEYVSTGSSLKSRKFILAGHKKER